MLTTTLARIREHGPCEDGWETLLRYLGKTRADDEPMPFSVIARSNGLDDALWCLRVLPESYRAAVALLACDFAERALRFVPEDEGRPRLCLDAVRRWTRDEATLDDVHNASDAAFAAFRDYCAHGSHSGAVMDAMEAVRAVARIATIASMEHASIRVMEISRIVCIISAYDAIASKDLVRASEARAAEKAWHLAHFIEWSNEKC